MNMFNLMAFDIWGLWYNVLRYVVLVIMALCAIFIIFVVLFQSGNSSGVSALGGTTETFLGKNKNKTFDHKMKILTVISGITFAVLCVLYAVISLFV